MTVIIFDWLFEMGVLIMLGITPAEHAPDLCLDVPLQGAT